MTRHARLAVASLAAAAAFAAATPPAAAEEVIRAVSAFPPQQIFGQGFARFIEEFNEAGKGKIRIQYLGGDEVTPGPRQPQALQRGAFDMVWGPSSYYLGIVPEGYALLGATVTPMEARERGGFDVLDEVWAEKLNARFLAWPMGGIGYNLYLVNEPKFTPDGLVDLSGLRIRIAPTYREFFRGLGATVVSMGIPEVHTGLERGLVEGLGWPAQGINEFGWARFINYQIAPSFMQVSLVLMMNRDRYNRLPEELQRFVDEQAVAVERASYEFITAEAERQAKIAQERGIEIVELEGPGREKYLAMADEVVWSRLKETAPEKYDILRARFTK